MRSARRLPRLRGRAAHAPDVGWHDLPAGTEILLGYADAAAAAASPAHAGRAGGRARPSRRQHSRRGGAGLDRSAQLGAPVVPLPPGDDDADATRGDGVTPTGIEAPPPGGFTQTPPVDPARSSDAARPELRLPGRRRRALRPRLRRLRAPTRASTRASTSSRPRARRSSRCRPACCTTSAGTASAAGGCGSRTANGNWFYYAHLSAYAPIAKNGAHVSAGDVVGFVGHTGDAMGTPSHLHFEIHPGGQWAVPPYDYLQAWQGHSQPVRRHPGRAAARRRRAARVHRHLRRLRARHRGRRLGRLRERRPPDRHGLVALGVPAPTASELLAAAPAP